MTPMRAHHRARIIAKRKRFRSRLERVWGLELDALGRPVGERPPWWDEPRDWHDPPLPPRGAGHWAKNNVTCSCEGCRGEKYRDKPRRKDWRELA